MTWRILAASLFIFSSSANAELFDRGGGLIYDDVLNVTWLAHANYGAGSEYDDGPSSTDGRMTWASATAWANNLVYSGLSNWRLPTAEQNCWYQADCTYGEIGHLFFNELGGSRGSSVLSGTNTSNLALFSGIQDYVYWTSLTDNRYPASDPGAVGFLMINGTQSDFWQRNDFFAWAVRDGDVPAVLSCDGFSPPADRAISVKKPNRVLPLRMTLRDSDGMSAWDLAAPVVNVNFAPANGDPSSDLEELTFAGRGDEGNQFLFDGTHWAFNLKTTGFAPGVYTITAKPGSADYAISPTCEVTLTVE